jgi:hypothetical protein
MLWDYIKQKATDFFRGAPGIDPNTPGRVWLDETIKSLPYLTPDLVKEATGGAMKGFAQGVIKGISLGHIELEKLKPKTQIEAEASKITGMIGELESWLIPFGIAEKGVGLALKGATKVPLLTKIAEKIPVVSKLLKATLPFATVSVFTKTEEDKAIEQKFGEGALWGLGFGLLGGIIPVPPSLKNTAKNALKTLAEKPQTIEIAKLLPEEKEILSRYGIVGEKIDKEIYARAMGATGKLNKIPVLKEEIKLPEVKSAMPKVDEFQTYLEKEFGKITPTEEKIILRQEFQKEAEALKKETEGQLFNDIKELGGIKSYEKGFLAEELKPIPISLRNNKTGSTLDEMANMLKEKGYNLEGDNDLLQTILDIRSEARPISGVSKTNNTIKVLRMINRVVPEERTEISQKLLNEVYSQRYAEYRQMFPEKSAIYKATRRALEKGKIEKIPYQILKEEMKGKPPFPPKPPKPPIAELPRYPEPEKIKLLKEIGEMPELPKIEENVLNWTPPTWAYRNPFTQKMYGAWNTINKWWIEKAPDWAKTFRNQKLGELTLERQRVIDGLTQKYTEEIINPLTKLSTEEKTRIGQMVFKYLPIEEKYIPTIKNIDLHIGQLGKAIVNIDKELVAKGVLNPEYALLSEDTWYQNLGSYMRTAYIKEPKVPGGKIQIIPRKVFTADGVLDRSAFKRKLTDAEWGANSLMFEGKTIEEIQVYSMKELGEMGKTAKTAWGWNTEADYVLNKTFRDMSNTYATRLWQKAVSETPELFSKVPKAGFVSIQTFLPRGIIRDIRLGMLNDGFVNPALEDEIKLFTSSARPIEAIFSEPLSWWKAFKVAGNPATVARNYISGGFIQTDMAGYPVWNPKNSSLYVGATKDYLGKTGDYKIFRDAGAYGADYYRVEIEPEAMKSIMKSAEVAKNPYQEYGARLAQQFGEKAKTVKDWFSYYGHIDHIQRTYLIKCAERDGATLSQAIHFANKWELNYRFAPKIIDALRTGLPGYAFPFISFYSLMAPRIAEVLITRPWVLLKYPILVGMASEYARNVLGLTKEQIEAGKPDFLKDQPYVMVLPYKDKQGNPIYLNMAYTLPFGSWETGFVDWKALTDLSKGAGLFGIVNAVLNNYDSFTGNKIYDEGDIPSEKNKKIAQYTLRALAPGAIQSVQNLWKASQGESIGFPYPERRDFTQTTLRALGISTYSGGYNDAYWKIKTLENEIESIQWALTNLLRNPNISQTEKTEKRQETLDYIKKKTEEIQKIRQAMPPTPTPYIPGQAIPAGLTPEQQKVLSTFSY